MLINTYQQKLQRLTGFQYTGKNQQDVIDFTEGQAELVDGKLILKSTTNGMDAEMWATNWIVKGPIGGFACISDLAFKSLYELIDNGNQEISKAG